MLVFIFIILLTVNVQAYAEESFLNFHNPWSEAEASAPEIKPYKLPRFDENSNVTHSQIIPPIRTAPRIDAESLYHSTLSCYPEKSKFNLEIDLETSFKNRKSYDLSGADIGQHYVAIVARMPLYSATELNREREREYARRVETSKNISALMQTLADRNHALRELGLYSSLEARAQVRVAQGVADTTEQVLYLEKVAAAQKALIKAESDLVNYRLALISQCSQENSISLNNYIKKITSLK